MSYILDALKKAAEQREAHAPAMRRLFSSPTPDVADAPRWRLAVVGGAAAVAGAVIAVWALWPTPPVVTETRLTPTAPVRAQPEAAAVVAPPSPSPVVARATPPKPPAPAKAITEKRAAPTPAPALQTRPTEPAQSAPTPPPPAAPSPVIAAVRPTPTPIPPAGAPAPTAAVPRSEPSGQMRLEVIVYSDERARRLAFINGRKYVEGDVLLDGSKIQEIQPNAVVIIDDGRRVVLRP